MLRKEWIRSLQNYSSIIHAGLVCAELEKNEQKVYPEGTRKVNASSRRFLTFIGTKSRLHHGYGHDLFYIQILLS